MSETFSRRPRFSLLTLLLVTTIVAMGLTTYLQWRELEPMRAELRKLREENGNLWIEDPAKIHAIRNATDRESFYRYRVYVPPGRQYCARYGSIDIPLEGTPSLGNRCMLKSGENVITVRHRQSWDKDRDEPLPFITFRMRMNEFTGSQIVHEYKNDWIVHKETNHSSYVVKSVGYATEAFPDTEAVVLFSMRAQKVERLKRDDEGSPLGWSQTAIAEPCDGFMLWIEPVRQPSRDRFGMQR